MKQQQHNKTNNINPPYIKKEPVFVTSRSIIGIFTLSSSSCTTTGVLGLADELCFSFVSGLEGLSRQVLAVQVSSLLLSGPGSVGVGFGSGLTGSGFGFTTTGFGFGNISSRSSLHSSQATNFVHGL
jgi:hypothetical protein